jgi:hypothetical protein
MRVVVRVLWIAAAIITAVTPSLAQDASRVGISIGQPAAIGVHIPASSAVTIRPEVSFGGSSVKDTTIETSSWTLGLNVSALVYVHHDDRLRTYIAPRLEYAHSSIDTSSSSIVLPALDSGRNTWGGSGWFGAQYALSDRFSVFGELGFGASTSRFPTTSGTARPSAKNWGTRTAVGIVFFR